MDSSEPKAVEGSSNDLKEIYRLIYTTAKSLDDHKKTITHASQLFDRDIESKRSELIQKCELLIFNDFETIGKKSREILWRKGYYDFIAFIKKNLQKEQNGTKPKYLAKVRDLLLEGFANYKRIAAKMEEIYDLDLQLFVDFSLINDQNHDLLPPIEKFTVTKSIESVSFALETIHSALLSLGDLHRYFIDFKFDRNPKITKEFAARFYYEAFKMNPTIGMAQNQLGTLFYGQNFDLDSIYHYLYSLICTVPFELSENNVSKLFLSHAEHLESLDPNKVEFSVRDFFARLFLIVDIFFFDKDVPDFNSLCHCVLVDLKKILCSKSIKIDEASLFKIVSIFLFCMSKLKMINSQKVYSLNAFLVAVCSDLIDSCIVNLEQYALARAKQNEKFQDMYVGTFNKFEVVVRRSRETYKSYCEKEGIVGQKHLQNGHQKSSFSTDSENNKSQKSDRDENKMIENETAARTNLTRSSDEAKESDMKTPLSNKSNKKSTKLRRRRRKIQQSDESSCYNSESDIDTDFSSNDENDDVSDLSSNFESDFSDMEDNPINPDQKPEISESDDGGAEPKPQSFSDNEDIVVEEENIIYPGQEDTNQLIEDFHEINLSNTLNFKSDTEEDRKPSSIKQLPEKMQNLQSGSKSEKEPPLKLKYKNKYLKIDPNIIIDFAGEEITMRCLKVLFDWLRVNQEILTGCYHSNPEFIHKIMKLLNYCNIDIFTRKVYFEREFISTLYVRQDLDKLFNVRSTIPLSEDYALRNFDLFQTTQIALDWEATIRDKITFNEETILRIFKMVDFGFFICKLKKFNYNFCAKTRRFSEDTKKKREKKSSRRRERRSRNGRRKECKTRKYSDCKISGRKSNNNTSNEEKDTVDTEAQIKPVPRKGYLKNRKINSDKTQSSSGADDEKNDRPKPLPAKCELMGRLWLENEIETLEKELKNNAVNVVLTPFIVVDTKALTEYIGIVKNLANSKKFIVLIPTAVIGDLDGLKKTSNGARAAIRWLEQEFKRGNRYLRPQREHENLPLSLIKIPRKLDRLATVFIQIAQFCNYIVTNHSDGSGLEVNVMTFLSGDNLCEKRHTNFSYTGILDAIPVRHDQISNYYSKYKSK